MTKRIVTLERKRFVGMPESVVDVWSSELRILLRMSKRFVRMPLTEGGGAHRRERKSRKRRKRRMTGSRRFEVGEVGADWGIVMRSV